MVISSWSKLPVLAFLLMLSCQKDSQKGEVMKDLEEIYKHRREKMVETQIVSRGVKDSLVLKAMRKVPRHLFVSQDWQDAAYTDSPLPIGYDQTISQPYIVALMTELLGMKGGEKILEVGTGSGYQSAIIAEIARQVFSIEIIESLAFRADESLKKLGYKNVEVKAGDGYQGWHEEAPFDGIIVTAAPDHIPQPLYDQLKMEGKLVLPVGDVNQELLLVTKTSQGMKKEEIIPVRFVPMTGEAGEK